MVQQTRAASSQRQVVNLNSISKVYNGKKILSDINFSINKNEIHAIVGPNGAGKTTLIRTILRLIEPTSGDFYLKYDDIATMLENDYLFENRTGRENIKSFACYFPINKESLDDYVEYLGLQDDLDQKVQFYSKGMKRKLTMLICAMRGTQFMIFDEPTSGVDPQSRMEIRKLFEKLKQDGKTILITSHDLAEIEKVCDRITILNRGHVIKSLINDGNLDLEKEFFAALKE